MRMNKLTAFSPSLATIGAATSKEEADRNVEPKMADNMADPFAKKENGPI